MIDRNVPKKFVADKDERLLQPGDMIEAQNITITERGEGSGSIVKTFKGASSASPDTGVFILEDNVEVVGKAEDTQNGLVYFFAAPQGAESQDASRILQYNPQTAKYKEVLKSSWLNFRGVEFVKGDVLNKDFDRDGVVETILYFTDNTNPPRRINVQKALAGDYDGYSNSELDIALSSMRAAPTKPPTFSFTTDTNVSTNNFIQDSLQYATQIIYNDGEVSALSPYSKLAISQAAAFGGLEESDYNVVQYVQNVCSIRHNIDSDHPELKKIRLLARSGNSGSFFVVDEFDPNTSVNRAYYGTDVEVYSSATQSYKFYNDILGKVVSDNVVNKLYDNVPLKAEGQALIGSRLMYSNYTEGFDNAPLNPDHFSITPKYSSEGAGVESFASDSDVGSVYSSSASPFQITLNLEGAANISDSTSFPAGTNVEVSFVFKPEFNAIGTGANTVLDINALGWDNGVGPFNPTPTQITLTNDETSGITFPTPNETNKKFSLSLFTPEEFTSSDALAAYIREEIDDVEVKLNYDFTGLTLNASGYDDVVLNCTLELTWKFGEEDTAPVGDEDNLLLKPRISRIRFTSYGVTDSGSFDNIEILGANVWDSLGAAGNQQNEITYSSVTNTLASESINISALGQTASFKQGANHAFGVVFYDKYGRSGFVNEIGSVYVKAPHERSPVGFGPVSMEFDFSDDDINNSIPSWADSYQIVYAGSNVAEVFQYTVGGAFPRRLTTHTGGSFDLDTSTHNLYISLKTLDQYRRDKDVLRDYSFTKGDKLRIISRRNDSDDGFLFPSSSDGDIMEFDVVGVETIDEVPLHVLQGTSHDVDDSNPHQGTFVVVTAPAVEAKSGVSGSENKYTNFDWYHVTDTDYPSGTAVTFGNYWNKNVLVEIITPKKATAEKVYYEIGERRRIGAYRNSNDSDMGPAFTVSSGDVHYRAVAAKTPKRVGSPLAWNTDNNLENPEDWEYTARYVEDSSISDLFPSKSWDRGRAHSVFNDAAEIVRYNSVTYSDAYADDTSVLSLSSFNPSLGNFFDLPSEYGACRYIDNISGSLVALQENKLSIVKVNKSVISTASQSGLVGLSTDVLSSPEFFGGDYGTQNPESALVIDGAIYFVDKARRAVLRGTRKGMEVLSDIDIKSFFDSTLAAWDATTGTRIISGYDPDDSVYFVTLFDGALNKQFTLGYNLGGFWQGTYTFQATCYAAINDKMIACRYNTTPSGTNDELIWNFTSESSNNFMKSPPSVHESKVTVVSNVEPSMVKQYNSISLEADSAWNTQLESSLGQTTDNLVFSKKEDAHYADVTGDTSVNSLGQFIPVGRVSANASNLITLSNSLAGLHIPKGYTLYKNTGSETFTTLVVPVTSVDYANKTISHAGGTLSVAVGDDIFVAAPKKLTGDQIRGHYCKIKCSITPSGSSREELYAINANFVNSKANHSKN